VDKHGLDEMDNRILTTIIEKFKGGPVGLTTIATSVSEDAGTIEEVYERSLSRKDTSCVRPGDGRQRIWPIRTWGNPGRGWFPGCSDTFRPSRL